MPCICAGDIKDYNPAKRTRSKYCHIVFNRGDIYKHDAGACKNTTLSATSICNVCSRRDREKNSSIAQGISVRTYACKKVDIATTTTKQEIGLPLVNQSVAM